MNAKQTHPAPYGFVPVNELVVHPDWCQPRQSGDGTWVAPPVHDAPFEDGVSGEIEIEIAAETPIFVRGANQPDTFFQLPDGRYAIPSTGIRGALRNVVEIASFSRMNAINDHRYAVRDLQNRHLYGQFMAEIMTMPSGKKEPTPLVNAGWLHRRTDDSGVSTYEIEVCDFAKIEYEELAALARGANGPVFDPASKQSAASKYASWGNRPRRIKVAVDFTRPAGPRLVSEFGKVRRGGRETRSGTLVFTGQPSQYRKKRPGDRRRGSAKHHDFVFFDAARPARLPVSGRVFGDFEFAHSDRGQQNRLNRSSEPNEEWGYWRTRLHGGEPVPVFFLTDEADRGQVSAMGLAMMFRLPYRHSIAEALRNSQGDPTRNLDLAEALFGTVRDVKEEGVTSTLALRGRVDMSHAVALGRPAPEPPVTAVLGAPKASYYPNYVEQDRDRPGSPPPVVGRKPRWTTYQDEGVRLRGWKRYRTQNATWQPEPPHDARGRPLDQSKVASTFRPLPADTRFRCRLFLHNLRPVELGALVWALDFGGDAAARHGMGLARPLGFGRSRIEVRSLQLHAMDGTVESEPHALAAARDAFCAYMEASVGAAGGSSWENSVQIQELVALARPAKDGTVRYQRLDPGERLDEFKDAKNNGSVLPLASDGGPNLAVAPSRVAHTRAPAPARGARRPMAPVIPPEPTRGETISLEAQVRIRVRARVKPNTASSVLPAIFSDAVGDEEIGYVVKFSVEVLGEKWLRKKASKAWMKPLLEHYERHGVTLS